MRFLSIAVLCSTVLVSPWSSSAQDREIKVRNDRKLLENSDHWIYNDLPRALRQAKLAKRPVLVVLRCIPCEACHEFDEQVVEREPRVRELLDQFVCVRIPQTNGLDLSLFQVDFDMSFAVLYLNFDGTLLGRFGTRTGRDNEQEDMHLEGFADSMKRVLDIAEHFDEHKAALAGKHPEPAKFATPEKYPMLRGKYTDSLDYQGKVVQSCIHCHQVHESARHAYRSMQQAVPDRVMFPWPALDVIGLKCDPQTATTVAKVTPGSYAASAGIQPGDKLLTMQGQPLVSVADIQWVLHQAGDSAKLPVTVQRGDQTVKATIALPTQWRRASDISWRASSWDMRRMVFGGMKLDPVSSEDRQELKLPANRLALLVKHVGQYGDHARAKQAGIQAGDILVSYDGRSDFQTESDLLAYGMQQKKAGDRVKIEVLRKGVRKSMQITLQ